MKRLLVSLAVAGSLALLVFTLARPRSVAASRSPHGRISATTGSLLVRGPDNDDWSYLGRNGAVHDGDLVWSDTAATTELEMERGAWLRLSPDTRVDLRRLPPDGDLELRRGSLYVDLSPRAGSGLWVRGAPGGVWVDPGSLVRLDLAAGDAMRLLVRHGRARCERPGGAADLWIPAGQQLLWDAATVDPHPVALAPAELDAFDRWCDGRVAYWAERPLPAGTGQYLPGLTELADYGEWTQNGRRRCWRPRVAASWRPYQNGYWGSWREEAVWVPREPWGYTTCHYGR